MDLEQQLRAAKPEADADLTEQNAQVLATLVAQQRNAAKQQQNIFVRFGLALVESPIPTLTASAAVLAFFLWQISVLLGEDGHWISQAAAFLMNRGLLP